MRSASWSKGLHLRSSKPNAKQVFKALGVLPLKYPYPFVVGANDFSRPSGLWPFANTDYALVEATWGDYRRIFGV